MELTVFLRWVKKHSFRFLYHSGRYSATHCLWNPELCCPWGTWFVFVDVMRDYITTSNCCECYLICHLNQVLNAKGYDGSASDIWSCGVILFVLMAGYLPFDEPNQMVLYKKVSNFRLRFLRISGEKRN